MVGKVAEVVGPQDRQSQKGMSICYFVANAEFFVTTYVLLEGFIVRHEQSGLLQIAMHMINKILEVEGAWEQRSPITIFLFQLVETTFCRKKLHLNNIFVVAIACSSKAL